MHYLNAHTTTPYDLFGKDNYSIITSWLPYQFFTASSTGTAGAVFSPTLFMHDRWSNSV